MDWSVSVLFCKGKKPSGKMGVRCEYALVTESWISAVRQVAAADVSRLP